MLKAIPKISVVCVISALTVLVLPSCFPNTMQRTVDTPVPDKSFEELCSMSNIVVDGTIEAISDTFFIDPLEEDEEPTPYTDLTVRVNKTFKGQPTTNDAAQITVRVDQGEGEYIKQVCEDLPSFSVGDNRLFFLYRIVDGTKYNTEGDHYYIANRKLGVWDKQKNVAGDYYSNELKDNTENITAEMLDTLAASAANLPTEDGLEGGDAERLRITTLHNFGNMDDAEFNERSALLDRAAVEYAHIMTDEEQHEYETAEHDAHIDEHAHVVS